MLTNARCLTEGIDVPSLDGIVFADPRRSQVDIVQAVGRVMRTNPNDADKVGRIVIPLVVPEPDGVDGDNVFEDSAFKPVWDVIRALKAHDFRLESALNRLRQLGALGPVSERDFHGATHLNVIGVEDLAEFQLAVINQVTPTFWWYLGGPLQQYANENGHTRVPFDHVENFDGGDIKLGTWVADRRKEFAKGKLSEERSAALDALPGWEWDLREFDFQRNLQAVRQYANENGHTRIPQNYAADFEGEDINVGTWVSKLRQEFKKGKLSEERIAALDALPGWEWDLYESDFQRNLQAARQYANKNGHTRIPVGHVENFDGGDINVGRWAASRRKEFAKGMLSEERIAALKALPGWQWKSDRGPRQSPGAL